MHARRPGLVPVLRGRAARQGGRGRAPRASAATFDAEEISSFTSDITIEPSGTLLVHETIVDNFGTVPHRGIFRDFIAREDSVAKPGYDRVYPLTTSARVLERDRCRDGAATA